MYELRKERGRTSLYQHHLLPDSLPHRQGDQVASVKLVAEGLYGVRDYLVNTLLTSWKEKSQFYSTLLDGYFHQPLGGDYFLSYPEEPTHHNKVKAHAILEPLKVRMITVGAGENWALKPLQRAMFNSMSTWKCFRPCFSPDYDDEIEELGKLPGQWLSGDYSAATDGLHSQIMGVAVEAIAQSLEDYCPELIPYLLQEGSPHTIIYPPWTELEPVVQTNGQLMGSLLSFPILCLANAFTICKATGTNLDTLPGLIHGDDVLARLTRNQFSIWGTVAGKIGLELSIGKNYFSPHWGSIDSQIFFEGKRVPDCGKWKGLSSGDADSVSLLIKRGFPKSLIVDYCKDVLKTTHRSLDVSREFGGLDPVEGKLPQTATDHAVYLVRFRNQLKFRKILEEEFAIYPKSWCDQLPFEATPLPFELPIPDLRQNSTADFYREIKVRDKGLTVPVGGFVPLSQDFHNIVVKENQKPFLQNFLRSRSTVLSPEDKAYFRCLAEHNGKITSQFEETDPRDQ